MFRRRRDPLPDALRGAQVPIVVGVTGHRQLKGDLAQLQRYITEECGKLAKAYANTPFLLLSGLAEGADRLVARIALETLPQCSLIAVLPMPRAEFETDFPADVSRKEFADLLARASAVIELEPAGDGWREPGKERNILYARVGAVIAEHAQVLFAIYDEQGSGGVGGTGDVVDWFAKGYAPPEYSFYGGELSPLDPPEAGLLLRINPATEQVVPLPTADPDQRGTKIGALLSLTDIYNRALGNKAKLITETAKPLPHASPSQKPIGDVYAAADTLAVNYAGRVRRIDRLMYWSALVAFLLFSLVDKSPAAIYGYALVTIFMFGIWLVMWWRRLENRFLEYRALAEAMRVLYFWRLAGITQAAWLGYLAKHSGVVHWVRHAVRAVEFQHRIHNGRTAALPPAEGVAAARTEWIDAQIQFYESAKDRHAAAARYWNLVTSVALAISYAVASIFVIYAWNRGVFLEWAKVVDGQRVQYDTAPLVLQLGLGITAAVSVAARAYLTRKADEDLVKQYASALQIFTAARKELAAADAKLAGGERPDWPHAETIKRLGLEALREHGEWLWLRHSRPFDVPK